jgi:hypothetical protein
VVDSLVEVDNNLEEVEAEEVEEVALTSLLSFSNR